MLRVIPLGGIGNVTNNMFVYEYDDGVNVQRLIVDCGIGFPNEEMLGADLLVPDVSYLLGKESSIVGIVLTHGHDDHIAGLPYILPQLSCTFPIYGSKLTAGFAKNHLDDAGIEIDIQEYPENEPLRLGKFEIYPIKITHSVPDSRHLFIVVGGHRVYHGSDFKFDWTPVDGVVPELAKIAKIGMEGIDLMLLDCLRVEKDGYSLSETKIAEHLDHEMRGVKGKIIFTTMSSNIHRIQQVVDEAVLHQRKVAFLGRSIENNIKIAQSLGFLNLHQNTIINKRKIKKFPDEQLCLIVAGSQGQIGSTLTRMANKEHNLVEINAKDHIVFSADPIPGNENNVYKVVDSIAKIGATVSYRDVQDLLHVSGHAYADELRLMLTLARPKNVFPIGGTYRHMTKLRSLAQGLGYNEENILLPQDGDVICVNGGDVRVCDHINIKTIIVDGLGIGDIGPKVLGERKQMAISGMFVVVIPLSCKDKTVTGTVEILTKGFVFAKQSTVLIDKLRDEVLALLPVGSSVSNWKEKREEIVTQLEKSIFIETQREPLIHVMLVES